MRRTDTVIIGGGQAGLAMSRCLTAMGIDHVVLERGRVGERWRSERWDSLTLLTPSWLTRLPGKRYEGRDPDGFMSMPEVIGFLQDYADSFSAPVHEGTTVKSVVEFAFGGYRVTTDQGIWLTQNVVLATGYAGTPWIPPMSKSLSGDIHQLAPTRYRNPSQLPGGGVLIVGASATGVQLADEIQRSGRQVTLAVGRHARMPRTYRSRDIMWWLDRSGILDEGPDDVFDVAASRAQPSLQLVGRSDRASIDVDTLRSHGVRLAGKLLAADGGRVHFADDLGAVTRAADAKLTRTLDRIDELADARGLGGDRSRPRPLEVGPGPAALDLRAEGIETIIWATGFRRHYPWLRVPVLGADGEIVHRNGITAFPGLYVLGMPLQRSRRSTYIDGSGRDAIYLAAHISRRLRQHSGSIDLEAMSATYATAA